MGQVQDPPILQTIEVGDLPISSGATNALVVSDQSCVPFNAAIGSFGFTAAFYRDDDVGGSTSANNLVSPGIVDMCGRQIVRLKTTSPTVTSVAASASSVTLLAYDDVYRCGATFYNDSTATAYLKLGATASTTSHTVQLRGGAYYEMPFGYIGPVDCIWSAATGSMRITELA